MVAAINYSHHFIFLGNGLVLLVLVDSGELNLKLVLRFRIVHGNVSGVFIKYIVDSGGLELAVVSSIRTVSDSESLTIRRHLCYSKSPSFRAEVTFPVTSPPVSKTTVISLSSSTSYAHHHNGITQGQYILNSHPLSNTLPTVNATTR